MIFHKLDSKLSYSVNKPIRFTPLGIISKEQKELSLDFSCEMTYGSGAHRDHRSGGTYSRNLYEIFINTLQGKLSEFAVFEQLKLIGLSIDPPDLQTFGLGVWDQTDLIANDKKINIKSTKHFGNLLLFECKDWNDQGEYIPNLITGNSHYDIFIFVRLKFEIDALKSSYPSKDNFLQELKSKVLETEIEYDIPGFILNEDLVAVIALKHKIIKDAYINDRSKIDADNYYVQAGDLRPINTLINYIE